LQNWLSIVQLNSDEEPFAPNMPRPGRKRHSFLLERPANPTSIVAAIANARENARNLAPSGLDRDVGALNVFHNRLKGSLRRAVAGQSQPAAKRN